METVPQISGQDPDKRRIAPAGCIAVCFGNFWNIEWADARVPATPFLIANPFGRFPHDQVQSNRGT